MKSNITVVELTQDGTGYANYKSGAVKWFTKETMPGTVKKVFENVLKSPDRYNLKKVYRPFVTGDAKTGYEYKEVAFYRVEV